MSQNDGYLFDLSAYPTGDPDKKFPAIESPLWTRNKALFIARYLKTFTYVTKHGTYIDAFAGPQHEEDRDASWAAKLVMENKPAWLRNFHLFEKDKTSISLLQDIRRDCMHEHSQRSVTVHAGDCNQTLPQFLTDHPIREKEATFCLFDQRSTECNWETVRIVANHKGKGGGHKIELFYFLAQGWIDRSLKTWKNDVEDRHFRWWGRHDVLEFLKLGSHARGRYMADRFKSELGYKYSFAFPIQQEGLLGRTMFWMIHSTDHDRGPDLMRQAYSHIGAGGGLNDPPPEQLQIDMNEDLPPQSDQAGEDGEPAGKERR